MKTNLKTTYKGFRVLPAGRACPTPRYTEATTRLLVNFKFFKQCSWLVAPHTLQVAHAVGERSIGRNISCTTVYQHPPKLKKHDNPNPAMHTLNTYYCCYCTASGGQNRTALVKLALCAGRARRSGCNQRMGTLATSLC